MVRLSISISLCACARPRSGHQTKGLAIYEDMIYFLAHDGAARTSVTRRCTTRLKAGGSDDMQMSRSAEPGNSRARDYLLTLFGFNR